MTETGIPEAFDVLPAYGILLFSMGPRLHGDDVWPALGAPSVYFSRILPFSLMVPLPVAMSSPPVRSPPPVALA
jgi:hypothetical protein